jgi:uncharacterized protein with HEPN domain
MSDHDDNVTLRQMLDYSSEAVELMRGRDEQALDTDRTFFLAMTRLLMIVGEAATRLSKERREELSEIPWRQVIGLRHILVHGYDTLDNPTLWTIVTCDLPQLIKTLEKLQLPPISE